MRRSLPYVGLSFAPGPQRVESGEHDPDFVARPVGFTGPTSDVQECRAPVRIQRQRTRGWRMPEGAVYVGRPTEWGNPWKVGDRMMVEWPLDAVERIGRELVITPAIAVALYAAAFASDALEAIAELGGRDLACWCPLDQPCHADVLLQLANPKENP